MSGAGVPAGKLLDLPHDSISNLYEVLRHEEGGVARRDAPPDPTPVQTGSRLRCMTPCTLRFAKAAPNYACSMIFSDRRISADCLPLRVFPWIQ
jgi:hypothetical protein